MLFREVNAPDYNKKKENERKKEQINKTKFKRKLEENSTKNIEKFGNV